MRAPARGRAFLYAAMLACAVAGRVLDAGSQLPGVHESAPVRGGPAGWATALVLAATIAMVAFERWRRTGSLRAVAAVVAPGQVLSFFAVEAVVRTANGAGPVDADGLLGAGLQTALALLLLLTMTAAWVVAVRSARLELSAPAAMAYKNCLDTTGPRAMRLAARLLARGPPSALCP